MEQCVKSLQLNANDINDACDFLFERIDLVDAALARENAQKEVLRFFSQVKSTLRLTFF